MKFIELEIGSTATDLYWKDKEFWETYDFQLAKWRSLEASGWAVIMHVCLLYPHPISFESSMRDAVKDFSDDVIVCYYTSNETFGVLRKIG